MRICSLFSGVGGLELGFSSTEVVYANEIDKWAAKTYNANHALKVDERDIREVDTASVPSFDVLLAGFPCQAFSVAGKQLGFDDDRGQLFFEIIRFAKAKQPRFMLLENVKNLISHDNGNTLKVIFTELDKLGYLCKYKVLNASNFNVPQNRERIYIACFREFKDYLAFDFPKPIPLNKSVRDVIIHDKVNPKYYYTAENFKQYDVLKSVVNKYNTIYTWRRTYVRENKKGLCPTLTANMGTGGHNVPLIYTRVGIRKLTPRECFSFQGFPDNFILPSDVADSHLYKQAGNSVCVNVIKAIANSFYRII